MSGEVKRGWILCSERLPKCEVLVETKCDLGDGMCCDGLYGKKLLLRWVVPKSTFALLHYPTHWRPLSDSERKEVEQDALDRAIAKAARPMYEACLEVAGDLSDLLDNAGGVDTATHYWLSTRVDAMRAKLHGATPDRTRKAVKK